MTGAVRRGAATVALLIAVGCDMTFPWSSGSPPDPPQALTAAAYDYDHGGVYLAWDAPLAYERYEVEWRIGAAPWQPALLAQWGPTAGRVDVGDLPEDTPLAFRLRGSVAGTYSGWSDEAAVRLAIRGLTSFAAEVGRSPTSWTRTGPVTLTWTNASAIATELLLERATVVGSEQPTGWAPLPGAVLSSGVFVDEDLQEGIAYAYRARAGTGGRWSAAAEVRAEAIEFAAPCCLRAVKEDGGVQLTWTNRSSSTEAITVARFLTDWGSYDRTATLPAASDGWFDPTPLLWPATRYRVTATRQGAFQYEAASSGIGQLEPFVLVGPPALAAAGLRLPEGEWYARDAAGGVHLAQGVYQSPRIHRATGTGWETHVLADADAFANPGILVDAEGAPHTVFIRGSPYGTTEGEIVHAWWEGGAWQSEVVATDLVAPGGARARFGLGSGGVQVLYRRSEPFPDPDSLVHVAAGGEGTVMTVVTTPSVPDFSRSSASFGVATDGTAYVAQLGTSASLSQRLLLLSTRSAGGVWSEEIVPTGAATLDGPWLAPGEAGDVAIVHTRDGGNIGDKEVRVVRKQGGTWLESELVTTRPHDGFTPELAFAGTADLARLALVSWSSGRTDLHVRDGSGWKGVTVGPSSVSRAGLGFVSGGAWALFPHDSAAQGLVPYSLFEEVR